MTTVLNTEMFEWSIDPPETATCEDCGGEMTVPDQTDPDADFMEPHFRRETHLTPCTDVWEALCDECYAEAVGKILAGTAENSEEN